MIGADAIVKCLEAEGVTTVFGYPGVAICPFYNSILDSKIRTVLVRTEQNAAHAASGVSRMTGRPGVCAVTSGPGATNVITGIATAFADSIPLICITGQVNSELLGSDVFQEADITGAVESFVKYSYLLIDKLFTPIIRFIRKIVKKAGIFVQIWLTKLKNRLKIICKSIKALLKIKKREEKGINARRIKKKKKKFKSQKKDTKISPLSK